ncbi:MAG TPA: acyl carrier protein [Bacteroidota bacterium]|nr:acyl carrier protein [Bacteroidota bacterium]
MNKEEIGEEVSRFIDANFLFDERHVEINESLVGSGTIDSTGILEVITFLEKRFNVTFEDEELVGDNFDTVDRIRSFLFKKLSSNETR